MSDDDRLRMRLRAHVADAGIEVEPLAYRIRQRISEEGQGRSHRPGALAGTLAAVLLAAAIIGSLVTIRANQSATGHPASPTSAPAAGAVPFPRLVQVIRQDPGGLWAVGSQAGSTNSTDIAFYTSTDDGRTWKLAIPLGAGSLEFARLFDGHDGLVLWGAQGNPTVVYATHDGGRHWTRTEPRPAKGFDNCQFSTPLDGWCIYRSTTPGEVWATKDGGATWAKLATLPGLPIPASVSFPNSDQGWIGTLLAGGQAEPPLLYKSTDGGRSWKPVQLTPPTQGYPGLSSHLGPVSSPDTGLLTTVLTVQTGSMGVGAPMALYAYTSRDDGQTWAGPVRLWSGLTALEGVPLPIQLTPSHWVVASGTKALISRDGGATWSNVQLPIPSGYRVTVAGGATPEAAYFVAQPTSCAQVACSVLVGTQDGGATWSLLASSPAYATPSRAPDNKGRAT